MNIFQDSPKANILLSPLQWKQEKGNNFGWFLFERSSLKIHIRSFFLYSLRSLKSSTSHESVLLHWATTSVFSMLHCIVGCSFHRLFSLSLHYAQSAFCRTVGSKGNNRSGKTVNCALNRSINSDWIATDLVILALQRDGFARCLLGKYTARLSLPFSCKKILSFYCNTSEQEHIKIFK